MLIVKAVCFCSIVAVVLACAVSKDSAFPEAEVRPTELVKHGQTRTDDYYWLRERENPDVINYLEAENHYLERALEHTKDLQIRLFDEITGRIKQNDETVPYRLDDFFYYSRYEEGKEYPIYCRRKGSLEAAEEIMLDGNQLAEGHEFFSLRGLAISSGQDILAYAVDTRGRRFYDVQFKNLSTGQTLGEVLPRVTGNVAWANDNRTVFYSKQDPATLRSFQVYRHGLGSDPKQDTLVYQEDDETFSVFVRKTKSKRYILIGADQTLSSEYRFLPADKPEGEFQLFLEREKDHEYSIDHYEERFYIKTNWEAMNFRLMSTLVSNTAKERWREEIPHRSDVYLAGFSIFRDYLVLTERSEGLLQIRCRPWDGGAEHYIEFDEPAYMAFLTGNPTFDTLTLRFAYMSMTTPRSEFDYDMKSRERVLLKQDEVLGDFSPKNYKTERIYAEAVDGVRIPISLVHRRGIQKNGQNPLLLYGYGSYGASMDATFSSARLSLLDRGFVFAIGHIRGGQEMGRQWYENGKLLKKKNTFSDFISCARHLVDDGYTNAAQMFIQGGSAGGLLVGAVINMAPDLFKGAVAEVPFVDVVTTMLDPDIPLTTSEYDEWGDPSQKEYYEYMLSYSPYDNVEAKAYPHLLVTAGLHDSQVQFWEPAKWVAKLRATKTDDNILILHTNMEAGHGGASGRFRRYRKVALVYAFLLNLSGAQID